MLTTSKIYNVFSRENLNLFFSGVLNSYSQVFFSDNRLFSVILLLVTFVDPFAGLYGLVSVLFTNLMGLRMGFNKHVIARGIYGFNSLLVGLGLGLYFASGWHLLLIVVLAAALTLFISIAAEGIIGKYGLPYLSVPFIVSIWIVMLATRDLTALGISHRGVFTLNELYQIGGITLIQLREIWQQMDMLPTIRVYFISLGAIFFQFNVLSGVIIAAGLLYYSRIAFTLSLLGFYSAFLFYDIVGANLDEVNYSYIGFNYILTAIAVGGFFIIPTVSSYLCIIFLIPMVALLTMSLSSVFELFLLPVYSLPFNIMVFLFLYILKFRTTEGKGIHWYFFQYNSPEKNLYAFRNAKERFGRLTETSLSLPFFGEWTVTQGYEGEHTHKEEWKHALDFEILDDDGNSFKGEGNKLSDYHCYGKSVLAPADGTVEEVTDDVADNRLGEVNLLQNWGNTVVIGHEGNIYTSLSHLKEKSVKVAKGERVKKGQIIAECGNSGRSPVPHLHFQVQSTPFTGSKTAEYPLGNFIQKEMEGFVFRYFEIPEKGDRIMNVEANPLMKKAFSMAPGKKIEISEIRNGKERKVIWEVQSSVYNKLYIECNDTGSRAWFENDGTLWFFTYFEGDRSSMLYLFYLAAYKVQLGFYKDLTVEDSLPVNHTFPRRTLFLQDFVAPFFLFLRSDYKINYAGIDNTLSPGSIRLESRVSSHIFGKPASQKDFVIEIDRKGMKRLTCENGKNITEALWKQI